MHISVIEFGVAGGAGLLSLERTAELVEARTKVQRGVHGFDTGVGLPNPQTTETSLICGSRDSFP